jgi:hypothetical protein
MPFRCSKTTMARLLGGCTGAIFREVGARIASANGFEEARNELQLTGRFVVECGSHVPFRRTIVFLEEITSQLLHAK